MTSFCTCKKPIGEPDETCSICGFMIPRPVLSGKPGMQAQKTRKNLILYICPTPECMSATVPPEGQRLEEAWTGPKIEDATNLARTAHGSQYRHNRAECPHCRKRGQHVQRIRMVVPIDVPVTGPPTPPLPKASGVVPVASREPEG